MPQEIVEPKQKAPAKDDWEQYATKPTGDNNSWNQYEVKKKPIHKIHQHHYRMA